MFKQVDFRRTGYYVVAPFSAATLRSMNYQNWLEIIKEMAGRRPVIVIGTATNRIPDMDMSAGEFIQRLSQLNNVIITIGAIKSLRVLMGLISKAVAFVGLDSGPLYIAQAFRTPAVSIWGSHDPGVRLGYDKDYMDLSIWNQPQCRMSPCYAYAQFPASKCSLGVHQQCCDVLASTTGAQVMDKLDMIESKNVLASRTPPVK
jgi:ADP-heptose:LPS heptosyltransferase